MGSEMCIRDRSCARRAPPPPPQPSRHRVSVPCADHRSQHRPPKTQQKSKEAKMAAAMAGGKSKKKKWSKGEVREKVANKVLFDDETYTRFLAEIPKVRRARSGPR